MAVVKTFQNKPAKFVPQETRRNLAASNVKTNRRNLSSLKTNQRKSGSNKAIKTNPRNSTDKDFAYKILYTKCIRLYVNMHGIKHFKSLTSLLVFLPL